MNHNDELLIVDFGSQYTQLIARRLRQAGYYATVRPRSALKENTLHSFKGAGIILAGSHRSAVDDTDVAVREFVLGGRGQLPVLGICYGMHLLANFYRGTVGEGLGGEYGAGKITLEKKSLLWRGMRSPGTLKVWMSHGDEVQSLPKGFVCTAHNADGRIAAFESPAQRIYAVQFHPEVSHTAGGTKILVNFARICGCRPSWTEEHIIDEIITGMQDRVGEKEKAIIALSGGVDSTVACVLAARALGNRIRPILVDTGLLRSGEADQVVRELKTLMNIKVRKVNAAQLFFDALRTAQDPEKKRMIIGKNFIRIFEKEIRKADGADWLVQGTIYPDVIESAAVAGARVIKSHHNVGGLPAKMKLRLLEPLRMLFKDEVRRLGKELGIPDSLLMRHPFPGPGLAVRIMGRVNRKHTEILRSADRIYLEELRAAGYDRKVSQAFCVFLPIRSVGVGGDERSYGYVIALRAVVTEDFMTAAVADLPGPFLHRTATRIINEVKDVGRVVYDCSSKPPATIEWE